MKLRAYWPAILALLLAAPASALDWEVTSLPPGFRFQLTNDPLGHIYAIGDSVLFTSTDDGATWTNRGAVARHLLSGSVHGAPGGQVFASDFAMGVFRSADGGGTWSASLVDEGCNGFAIHPGGDHLRGPDLQWKRNGASLHRLGEYLDGRAAAGIEQFLRHGVLRLRGPA